MHNTFTFHVIIDDILNTRHRTGSRAREKGGQANQQARRAADNPWVERLLLGLVALGFIALGLPSIVSAIWIRMTV